MKVTRGKDSDGNGVYEMSSGLVHMLIVTFITSFLAIGAYMIAWAYNDSAWKAAMTEKQVVQDARLMVLEAQIAHGILPIARERLTQVERRLEALEHKK